MFTGNTKLQQGVVVLLVCSMLFVVAGCGGNKEQSNSGSEAAPQVTVAMDALPTMPSAHFAAPTTMITPESAKAEATAEVTATVEVTTTTEVSSTGEVTGTGAVTATK